MLDASRVILGTYGQAYIDGVWQTHVNKLEASVEIDKRELNLVGNTWKVHKNGAKKRDWDNERLQSNF